MPNSWKASLSSPSPNVPFAPRWPWPVPAGGLASLQPEGGRLRCLEEDESPPPLTDPPVDEVRIESRSSRPQEDGGCCWASLC